MTHFILFKKVFLFHSKNRKSPYVQAYTIIIILIIIIIIIIIIIKVGKVKLTN
jgi:hypothetical protein